jgi:hypothetical protein
MTRHVLEAVLWILNTGAQWHMLPQSYPNYKTMHRRFHTWCCNEILRRVLTDIANELRDKGALDEDGRSRLGRFGRHGAQPWIKFGSFWVASRAFAPMDITSSCTITPPTAMRP